jgi:hypothetical protein
MSFSQNTLQRVGRGARSGLMGMLVVAVGFFDAIFLGLPIAVLAASFGAIFVFAAAAAAVTSLAIACCGWVDRRWDEWSTVNADRVGRRLEQMRSSRLMAHPVAWVQRGSDRWYAVAAALANPVLVVALARTIGGQPIGPRRILLGSVAYAIPYVALWSLVGFLLGDTIRAL